MRKIILLSFILPLFFACSTSKNMVYKQTSSQIFFGNYGGFTNVKLEYVLNDDGNIFKIEKDSTFFIKKINREQLKDIQNSIDEDEFRKTQVNTPGNITYFVRLKTKEFENRVIWSDNGLNKPVEILYNKLFDLLKD